MCCILFVSKGSVKAIIKHLGYSKCNVVFNQIPRCLKLINNWSAKGHNPVDSDKSLGDSGVGVYTEKSGVSWQKKKGTLQYLSKTHNII